MLNRITLKSVVRASIVAAMLVATIVNLIINGVPTS